VFSWLYVLGHQDVDHICGSSIQNPQLNAHTPPDAGGGASQSCPGSPIGAPGGSCSSEAICRQPDQNKATTKARNHEEELI
jgi:hypothetical protein